MTKNHLQSVIEKVQTGQRLTTEDGLTLFRTPDIWTVIGLADLVRKRLHGKKTYYNINQHINYTNVCALSCKFCSFYRKTGQDGAYEYSLDQIADEATKAQDAGATEIHIVGGLHPHLPFSYYTNMLQRIHEVAPRLHIKAFTAVEIVHLARIDKRPHDIRGILLDLVEAGLGSLPGGGAEVFDDRAHDEAFKGKIRGEKWLEVNRIAHEIGLNTNATILYGHIETTNDRIRHMEMLRESQDQSLSDWAKRNGNPTGSNGEVILTGPNEMYPNQRLPMIDGNTDQTGHFQTIVPLPFIPDHSELEHLPGPSGLENLRMISISRLMLDNFPHVKAFWIMQTLNMAQLMLNAGADDIDGTVVWYDITRIEGGDTHQETNVRCLRRAITEAGGEPVERDTLYRPIERNGKEWKTVAQSTTRL